MAEADLVVLPKGVCQTFTPQQWRKTKCKLCFHDIIEHTKSLTKEGSEELIKSSLNDDSNQEDNDDDEHQDDEETVQNNDRIKRFVDEHGYSSQSNYTQGSSKGSSDRLDVDAEDSHQTGGGDKEEEDSDNDDGDETDGTHTPMGRRKRRGNELSASLYSLENQDSIDGDDGTVTQNRTTQKRRTRSYRKNSSNLLQLSALVRSSNSSLCSFTSEMTDGMLTDGYSDYDYDVRSVTDDTDDYAEINDVIDELEMIKPELKVRVQNERRISRSKIFDLERELEGQHDYYRATEIAKDRQIKSLHREIEGLKLELSSVKAHENILALKSRLDSEGKTTRIQDLENQIDSLKDEILQLSSCTDVTQSREDILSREVKNGQKRIQHLEEENRATEERLKLAEDLQFNDRELLEVLRTQLGSIDDELVTTQDSNRLLEDKLKLMELMRTDFLKEQDKCSKLTKEGESFRQKIKRRDRHIEDLEDDNVKLQQLKTELESQLSRREFKVKKFERKVSELRAEVTCCNKQIADLTGENKTLEQVRRLTDLQIKDLTHKESSTSEVQNGEKIFLNTLEDRLKHNESRVKELELENDNFLKQIHEIYESLLMAEKQTEECKEELKVTESKCTKLRQESKHSDKKIEMLHRKLLKSEKEKKRAINRQNTAELKITQLEKEYSRPSYLLPSDNCDANGDKSSRMLRLKLQSTEAKLSMIEGNKGYLEAKVMSLERKVRDKDQEIMRLHDSMERDSGAPSQDYDRFDSLERENIMLQTKLDDFTLENLEQKESLNQLKENNAYLEITIHNLNEKLDVCTRRLKEVEEANHKLGREALRRTQSISSNQGEVDASINELRSNNKLLQEKVKHFDNVEELLERLEVQVKKEQGHAQWYYDENEHLKVKIAKMAETINSLEKSKKEFQISIQQLSEENKEVNNDVKRLEEKLEIYGDLFGKDSTLYSSLKRRSFQSERDEEKIIENALSPLMEEIKEKDVQIKILQQSVLEKDATVNTLTEEIDLLEANLAAMVTEKIKRSSDPILSYDSENNSSGILSFDRYRKGSKSFESPKKENIENRDIRNASLSAEYSPIQLEVKIENEDIANVYEKSVDVKVKGTKTSDNLTISTEHFYNMLQEQEELLKRKDIEYYRTLIDSESESPNYTDFYRTIEAALLDQYKEEEEEKPNSPLPHSSGGETENFSVHYDGQREGLCNQGQEHKSIIENKMLVNDMYEQLAELEDMVKASSARSSPNSSSNDIPETVNIVDSNPEKPVNIADNNPVKHEPTDLSNSQSIDNVYKKHKGALFERHALSEPNSIDLSGLDDLLAEVSKRNSVSNEVPAKAEKEIEVASLKVTSVKPVVVPKTVMPSIRTTRRRIIRLGGLSRSDSFDSATNRSINQSICSISSQSSSNILPNPLNRSASFKSASSSSSLASSTSMASVIYIPSTDRSSPQSQQVSSTENISSASSTPPYRRPNIEGKTFLNSPTNNVE